MTINQTIRHSWYIGEREYESLAQIFNNICFDVWFCNYYSYMKLLVLVG